ncbi:pseudouridine synthase [uncultured Lutibacter sp.]|uniref:pseudouridine synthase n=1 Tax=uncultured Lutibacter sp. TaxID=437739 RepID=UPI00262D7D91|nr:pseudouridine synthase [uncultured Lutibacter sp.]
MKIEILFEDNYIIVVNKPNKILIHNSYYARNIKEATLLDLLKEEFQENYYPIHRLDRKTSGVLVLAKQKKYVAIFQELFNSNSIQKKYLGIVRGFIETPCTIKSPVKHPDTKLYKDAETLCEPILNKQLDIAVHPYQTSRYSLVRLKPSTGRMHQLRIHMNKISHPIVGDYKYGDRFHNRMFENELNCDNLFLHAHSIHFEHPLTKEKLDLYADLPLNWQKIFEKFSWQFEF